MVVEDERKVAGFLKQGLEEEGYEVDCAYDGEEALECLRARPYDLVILDLMLPRVDGLEVLRRFRGEMAGGPPCWSSPPRIRWRTW